MFLRAQRRRARLPAVHFRKHNKYFNANEVGNNWIQDHNLCRIPFSTERNGSFHQVAERIDLSETDVLFYRYCVFIRSAAINVTVQEMLPQLLQQLMLWLRQYPACACHSRQRRMYRTMRRNYYWSTMEYNIYHTVSVCLHCAVEVKLLTHNRKSQLLPASTPRELVVLNILELFRETTKVDLYFAVITYKYSKLTKVVPTAPIATTSVKSVVCIFPYDWIIAYRVSA